MDIRRASQLKDGYYQDTKEPTGFLNRTDSTLSFDNATRTFTITPASTLFKYYSRGVFYYKSAAESIVISNTEGLHWIYYDGTTLSETTTSSILLFTEYALIAAVYWDVSAAARIHFGEERHGITMPGSVHYREHVGEGTAWISGLALGDFSVDGDGSSNSHAQLSCSAGFILDEDNLIEIIDGSPQDITPTLTLPVYYRSGASDWNRTASTTYPVITGGSGRLAWNQLVAGSWQQTNVNSGSFVLAHIFATNDLDFPVIAIQGQATYNNIPSARAGAEEEIKSLSTVGLPFAEFIAIGSVIFQTSDSYTNAVKARIRTTDSGENYVDFRRSQGISAGNPFGLPLLPGLEVSSVRFAGAKADGVTDDYAVINAVISAIGTSEQTLYFGPGTYYIGTSITTPENINVVMERGVVIQDNGDAGVNVTIQGNLLTSPGETHFNLTGGGTTSISNTYRRIRVQESIPSSVSSSGTGEDNLMTFTLPQNSHLYHNTIRIIAAGTKTNANGNKTLKFYFGTDSVTFHPAANDEIAWRFEADIVLVGAQESRCMSICHHSTFTSSYDVFTTDDLSAGDITLKVTGECANGSDTITQTMFIVQLF